MSHIKSLKQSWEIPDIVTISAVEANLPVINIHNEYADARISLQGAHITHFKPKHEKDMIWISDDATYAPGKSLRGGIPICWPWFGPHASNSDLPGHGPARTVDWEITHCQQQSDGRTSIKLEMVQRPELQEMYGQELHVQIHIIIGTTLQISLITKNLGTENFTLSQAFHTYFYISNIKEVHVEGLEGCQYIDKIDSAKLKEQQGSLNISQETDRIYLSTPEQLRVIDPGFNRAIKIQNQHSASAIVWNPWIETAEKMGDLGEQGYLNMLCVETANAASDSVQLKAGESYFIKTEYSIEKL
ncbi:MAG: D-hexose-6-phosphate mutarotase [Mariprofundaceae bacterium]